MGRPMRALAAAVAVAGMAVPGAGTAGAWTNSLSCDSGGYNNTGGFQCWAYATGVRPLQNVNWWINGARDHRFDGQLFPDLFECSPGTVRFFIIIVDANGAVQVIDEPEICRTGEWN
ncbi:hypothetical protein JOD54_006495 [Actinokineospora baliensis]|uniref:hypothetical protein n=1 Tax=Actinokineospora baliensis TaxID=547056 RepID=UPI00195C91DE|nr:hypothetical protein [Actinokineospora baliensis]MBM7776291.1 hypothetical protein [Actinokineospora baliensis]